MDFCQPGHEFEFAIPGPSDRPKKCPDGYICLNEVYFTKCNLRFPILAFFMQYCWNRQLAVTQFTDATIRNVVALKMHADQCGVNLTAHFFEEATTFLKIPDQPGMYYASAVPKIVYFGPSKFHKWMDRYFYVKVTEHVLEDPFIGYLMEWNLNPGSRRSAIVYVFGGSREISFVF